MDQGILDRITAVFATMDANKSGALDIKELEAFISASGLSDGAAAIQAKSWFNSLNENADQKITIEEFQKFLKKHQDEMGKDETVRVCLGSLSSIQHVF